MRSELRSRVWRTGPVGKPPYKSPERTGMSETKGEKGAGVNNVCIAIGSPCNTAVLPDSASVWGSSIAASELSPKLPPPSNMELSANIGAWVGVPCLVELLLVLKQSGVNTTAAFVLYRHS